MILIDTGAGNDKTRPQQPVLDHLSNPFLERLADSGITPEMVDYVIHTHIHFDHVGWNTRLADGQWRPTFPDATTICSRLEWDYVAAVADGNEKGIAEARAKAGFGDLVRIPGNGTFNNSMRPLVATGRVRLVDVSKKEELLPGIRLLPTAGHSIDHVAIELIADGSTASVVGDGLIIRWSCMMSVWYRSFANFRKQLGTPAERFSKEQQNEERYIAAHASLRFGRQSREENGD